MTDEPPAWHTAVLLKVKPGMGEGFDWIECGSCDAGWQVPHYAVAWMGVCGRAYP